MAKDQPNYLAITLRRGEAASIVLEYRPEDPDLEPYDLSGKTAKLRVKPSGLSEINLDSAIGITNPTGGELTIEIPGSTIANWEFQNAKYAVLLDDKQLIFGDLTIKEIYE